MKSGQCSETLKRTDQVNIKKWIDDDNGNYCPVNTQSNLTIVFEYTIYNQTGHHTENKLWKHLTGFPKHFSVHKKLLTNIEKWKANLNKQLKVTLLLRTCLKMLDSFLALYWIWLQQLFLSEPCKIVKELSRWWKIVTGVLQDSILWLLLSKFAITLMIKYYFHCTDGSTLFQFGKDFQEII